VSLATSCACALAQESAIPTFEELENAQRAFAARQRETVVELMSLETMFPDERVRELARAAGRGDLSRIDELVAEGVDVNARGTSNAVPLYRALRSYRGFVRLLELGADPNVVFDDNDSIMETIVLMRDDRFLAAALEHGGDPNFGAGTTFGSLLHWATDGDTKDKIPMLLDAGADINARAKNGETPIMDAAGSAQFDVVYDLLERGADYKTISDICGNALAEVIAWRLPRLHLSGQDKVWFERVIEWLDARGVGIPDDNNRCPPPAR
jgi:ankyrin repeat protein